MILIKKMFSFLKRKNNPAANSFNELAMLKKVRHNTVELNSFNELKRILNWKEDPEITDKDYLLKYNYSLDANDRKLHDFESVCGVLANVNARVALEIGTSQGHMSAFMADNTPNGKVFTVNIHPDEINKGGVLTTYAPSLEQIGSYYKSKGHKNIEQIIANTATWVLNIGTIDVAFIDGSHDTDFVYNDTKKILEYCKPGSFIMWHDFNLDLAGKHEWIKSVMMGVEKLYLENLIKGEMFHIKDSWVGIYQVK